MTNPFGRVSSETLDDYGKISRLCSLCSRMCRHSCPTHLVTSSDGCSPVGRALIVELHRGGKSAFTEAAVDRMYQCNLCSACKAWCKPKHELPRIIELARARIVQEHRAPQGALDLEDSVTQSNNVYSELHSQRFAALPNSLRRTSDPEVVFFVGCTTAYRHPEIARATAKVLRALGIQVGLLEEPHGEVCCGSPLLRAGFTETARKLAQQNVVAILNASIQTVVTTCPGCARALRLDYPRLGTPLPKNVRVYHISEFLMKKRSELEKRFTQSPLPPDNGEPVRVTYHDPCHLGRELEVFNQPRQLLRLLPQIDLIEFQHNQDHADCCGGGGALPKTFPELANQVSQRRLKDTLLSRASYLISACPNCKHHFNQTPNTEVTCEILDLMELLARAIK